MDETTRGEQEGGRNDAGSNGNVGETTKSKQESGQNDAGGEKKNGRHDPD